MGTQKQSLRLSCVKTNGRCFFLFVLFFPCDRRGKKKRGTQSRVTGKERKQKDRGKAGGLCLSVGRSVGRSGGKDEKQRVGLLVLPFFSLLLLLFNSCQEQEGKLNEQERVCVCVCGCVYFCGQGFVKEREGEGEVEPDEGRGPVVRSVS